MFKLLLTTTAVLLLSFTFTKERLTKKEKKAAVSYFKETQNNLAREIYGLTEHQLNWKPADSVWSVANTVEHITLSEKNLFDWAMSTLKENADPAKRSQLKYDDEGIKNLITNRTVRVKTREGFIPTGQFGDAEQTMKVFNERREALIKYMKGTTDDLRNHFGQMPFGLMDTYQLLIFLSAHTQRHILQIAELKANPLFPKV